MKKYVMALICLSFAATACTTTYYRSESKPLHFEDGSTQVKIKFNESVIPEKGAEITALNKTCATKNFKDRERVNCVRQLASIGKVVGVTDQMATVEFKQGTGIDAETEYEVLKNGAK
ncbi:MAG: hypothetical protein JSU04_08565 [Bdellovibrionales bacterium]|nr:hypothetical protein [Bdellovibrionales bacterium]